MREIIIGHVEFALIFLFDDSSFKIAILEPLKVHFLNQKQKLLSDNGRDDRVLEKYKCAKQLFLTPSANVKHILILYNRPKDEAPISSELNKTL